MNQFAMQRRAHLFVQALWGKNYLISVLEKKDRLQAEYTFIDQNRILLVIDEENRKNSHLIRAASAHAAAHLTYSSTSYSLNDINPRQKVLIELIEDARVELEAIRRFPGLRQLWLAYYAAFDVTDRSFVGLCKRLARSLLDPDYSDEDLWIRKAKKNYFHSVDKSLNASEFVLNLGLALANDIGQMRLSHNATEYCVLVKYRDDNRHLWTNHQNEISSDKSPAKSSQIKSLPMQYYQQTEYTTNKIFGTESGFEAGRMIVDDKDQAALEYNYLKELNSKGYLYPEWYQAANIFRNDWCKIMESQIGCDNKSIYPSQYLKNNKILIGRLKTVIDNSATTQLHRTKKQTEGDNLDLDAALQFKTALKMGSPINDRFYERTVHSKSRQFQTLILLDLSESANQFIKESESTMLELTRQVVLLFSAASSICKQDFSLAGFNSNGRSDCRFVRIKNFDQPFDGATKARIANIKAEFSTRLGVAIRHATSQFEKVEKKHKLIVVLTDGSPSDIDVFDPEYLIHDARKAASEANKKGISCICLAPNRKNSAIIESIFGVRNYYFVEGLTSLPFILSKIYSNIKIK